MHPLLPLLHTVVALHMCQPVQRLVGMVIHPAHRLIQCCAVDALPRRHRPDSGVSPLMLGRRGRHSYGSEQQARAKADARTMLLQPICNCQPARSPALLHPAVPEWPRKTRDQRLLDAELEGRTETSVRLQRMKIPWSS